MPRLAQGSFPTGTNAPVGRLAYAEMLARGGYPEAQGRTANRRARFFESYIDVEVKSAATVHKRDLCGLALLRDELGGRFKAGALLYTGANTVPFGDRPRAREDSHL